MTIKNLLKKLFFLVFCLTTSNAVLAQVLGCTDPLANNYDSLATMNDGSCTYDPITVLPAAEFNLDSAIVETSGLMTWRDKLWTHNDNTDNHLYAIDTLNGNLISTTALDGLSNIDWESISQDSDYIYIGDFGNNVSGNRTNLRIFKIQKQALLNDSIVVDTIAFSYANQINFNAQPVDSTDFDCEAMVATSDSIYLFTKQWHSLETSLYALPKTPGNYSARLEGTLNVDGLITGAVLLPHKKLVVLCGYSNLLQPFLYLLYDFQENHFFEGNKRKVAIGLPFHQIEGIASTNGLKFYVTNEYFSHLTISVPQQMHVLNLHNLLSNYLNGENNTAINSRPQASSAIYIFPNPACNRVTISGLQGQKISVFTQEGRIIPVPILQRGNRVIINVRKVPSGIYILVVKGAQSHSYRLIVKH